MDFVDEQHRIFVLFQFGHDGFEAFFKITAIPCACQQRAHVERINCRVRQHGRGFACHDFACETFGNGGFTDARVTHQQRIVLAAAAEHLNATLDFRITPDQRINVAFPRFGVEVDAVLRECGFLLFALRLLRLRLFFVLRRAGYRAAFAVGRVLGNPMRDEVDRVIAGHVLILQEVGCVAFTFGKDCDKHVCAGNF